MNNQDNILGRIRYAWVHADCAMEKVTPYYRERVRKVIGGDLPPFDYLLRMIAEATNRSVEWLLTGEDEGTRLLADPEFVESLEQLRNGNTVPAKTLEEEQSTRIVEQVGVHAWDEPCDSNCLCEETPMVPVPIAEPQAVTQWHVFTPTGDGTCIGCGGGADDAIHNGLKTGTTCPECLHASPHDQAGIGICRVKDCGCDGTQMCEECPHFWVLHTSGDDGCEACDCKAGARVQRPRPKTIGMIKGDIGVSARDLARSRQLPRSLGMGHSKVVTALAQRVWSEDQWDEFFYVDSDRDELMIREDHTDKYGPAVYILTSPNGCSIPLDTLEAVVQALRESGRRAMEEPK